ncbi:hypothetical protein [Amycolatopsis marina]|uniref:hypothetical protein n=1 Tax=Amycolatopsis marina TaxID=490629 RepID=UPI003CCB83DC
MRGRLPRTLALPVTAAVLALSAAPALAQDIPTTPIPEPANPGQPPISSPPAVQPLGKAVGDAGTALGMLRLLPNAVPTSAILPGLDEELPKQSAFEGGLGLSSAQANSESYLAYERSIAQSSPFGISVAGNAPQAPGSLVQTALPDNPKAVKGGLKAPENPLLNVGLLEGTAHARWSSTLGPCVGTIADSTTSLASLSLLNVIPSMPDASQLTEAAAPLKEGLEQLPGPLASLGGLLDAPGDKADSDGTGSVLSLPNTLSSRSTVRLVDIKGTDRKAVQSISTMQAADINILKGTPLGLNIKVASQPTLTVTSTGDKDTSKVEYSAPVLTVERGGEELFTLDAANPTKDVPIGIPLPELGSVPGFENFEKIPVVGAGQDGLGRAEATQRRREGLRARPRCAATVHRRTGREGDGHDRPLQGLPARCLRADARPADPADETAQGLPAGGRGEEPALLPRAAVPRRAGREGLRPRGRSRMRHHGTADHRPARWR